MPADRASSSRIAVLIADDHEVVRRGLRQVLAETGDIMVAGEAATAREVLQLVRGHSYDVVVLDLSMPGTTGVELLETIRREQPALPVLVLSMHAEDQHAARVLRAGGAGFLPKEAAAAELVRAIRKVHAGGKYVTARTAERLASDLGNPAGRTPHELLSNREHQVLCLIGKGRRVKEIAHELHLSEKTVSTYRTRLLEKLQLAGTAELIRFAIQHRLVD